MLGFLTTGQAQAVGASWAAGLLTGPWRLLGRSWRGGRPTQLASTVNARLDRPWGADLTRGDAWSESEMELQVQVAMGGGDDADPAGTGRRWQRGD